MKDEASKARETAGKDSAEGPAPESDQDQVVGERSIASINRARSLQSRISNLLALGLMCSIGVGLLTWYYRQTYTHHVHVREAARSATQAKAQGDMALPSLGPIDPPAPTVVVSAATQHPGDLTPTLAHLLGPAPAMPAAAATPVLLTGRPISAPRAMSRQRVADRRLSGPVFSTPGSSSDLGADQEGAAAPPEDNNGAVPFRTGAGLERAPEPDRAQPSGDAGPMAALLQPSVTATVNASVLPTQDLLLPKGAFIDCTLETAIDSSLPGLTTCITATDTFSADGRVVLLERGTKLVGETRGTVQQGSSRVFVLWTEARTPTGVVVPLASPGTDELGRSGLPGTVNRHFFERFGAALLISIIDGGIQAEVAAQSKGGTVIYTPTTSEDVMTEALKSTVNIPPTVVKQNGDRIQVLVARDLDFRSVYQLRPVVGP